MMALNDARRRALTWAIAGGVVLAVGVVAIIITALSAGRAPAPLPTAASSSSAAPSGSATLPSDNGSFVNATVSAKGWTPEPVTTNPETYARAALEAASTFDTQKSSREEWLAYLDSWFTVDTRYTSEADQRAELAAAQLELRQSVVLPQQQWESLAGEKGRVVAATLGEILLMPVPDDASGDMAIATAGVTLTYTRTDASGTETSYEEAVRVSVQVLCGPASVPVPNTDQRPGDCKVVRYFPEPIEP